MTRRLDRGGESTAARIMLPAYPILCTYLGVMYLSPPEALLASPVLEVANEHLPIHLWGVLFLLVAAVQVVALIVHRCILYEVALILMVVAMVVWAAVFVAGDDELHEMSTLPVVVNDTVGAGDSFMAGFISGLLDEGLLGGAAEREALAKATWADVVPAVERAIGTSTVTVGRAGAYGPSHDEIAEALARR